MFRKTTAFTRHLARAGLCAALLGAAQAACAGPIVFDSFLQFSFDTVGGAVKGCDPADADGLICLPSSGTPTEFLDAPAWTFAAPAGGASLTVLDAFLAGDEFDIFDFGVLVGSTSTAFGRPLPDCGDDPAVCLATIGMSTGVFAFAEGAHALTLVSTRLIDGAGSGYLRLEAAAAVPEPTTAALVLAALAALAGARRRKNDKPGSAA